MSVSSHFRSCPTIRSDYGESFFSPSSLLQPHPAHGIRLEERVCLVKIFNVLKEHYLIYYKNTYLAIQASVENVAVVLGLSK